MWIRIQSYLSDGVTSAAGPLSSTAPFVESGTGVPSLGPPRGVSGGVVGVLSSSSDVVDIVVVSGSFGVEVVVVLEVLVGAVAVVLSATWDLISSLNER